MKHMKQYWEETVNTILIDEAQRLLSSSYCDLLANRTELQSTQMALTISSNTKQLFIDNTTDQSYTVRNSSMFEPSKAAKCFSGLSLLVNIVTQYLLVLIIGFCATQTQAHHSCTDFEPSDQGNNVHVMFWIVPITKTLLLYRFGRLRRQKRYACNGFVFAFEPSETLLL